MTVIKLSATTQKHAIRQEWIDLLSSQLIGLILGLLSAATIGANQAFLSKPLVTVRPSTITYFGGLISLASFFVAVLLSGQAIFLLQIPLNALLVLVAYGIVQFGIVRLLAYNAIKNIGANFSSVITPTEVVFAAFFAIIFLSESLNAGMAIGTVLLVAGAMLLNPGLGATKRKGNKKMGAVFSISAALSFGASSVLVKAGLTLFPHFVPAVFISSISGVLFNAFILTPREFVSSVRKISRSALIFILISTVFAISTQFFKFAALTYSTVVIFVPLMGTYPVFVLVMTRLFAGETEVFDRRTLLIMPLVITGALLVGIYSV